MASQSTAASSRSETGETRSRFDVFISYSHAADRATAANLQRLLQRFAKPIYRLRSFRVFRDETVLTLTPGLWPVIEEALRSSSLLLLIANPLAAESAWVQKEVSSWIGLGRQKSLLIAWTGGNLRWDSSSGDFDWSTTDAIPRSMAGIFRHEPLYLDLRWIRNSPDFTPEHPDFRVAVAKVAAAIRAKSLDEVFGDDIRQHRRNRLIAWVGVAALAGMGMVAVWRSVLEVQARHLAEKKQQEAEEQRAEANRQRSEAEREAFIATSRLAQSYYERSLAESEDRGKTTGGLLLAAQASAAAPNKDPRRDTYRLRALYLALKEPNEVHQIGRSVRWAMLGGRRAVTMTEAPHLDLWDASSWNQLGSVNTDPKKLPVTGVSPVSIGSAGFNVLAHEAVDLSETRGSGWNNLQSWSFTGKLADSQRAVSGKTYKDWYALRLPSIYPVSLRQLAELRQTEPNFESAVIERIAKIKTKWQGTVGLRPVEGSPLEFPERWWIDALDSRGSFVLATYYPENLPETNTWNGDADWQTNVLATGSRTAVFAWNGERYAYRGWDLKGAHETEFPRSAGFGVSGGKTVLWVVRRDGSVSVLDAATGGRVTAPLITPENAWVRVAGGVSGFAVIEGSGRVSLRDISFDPALRAGAALDTETDLSTVWSDGDRIITGTGYSPSGQGREIAMVRADNGRQLWHWRPENSDSFALSAGFALSPSRRFLAAILGNFSGHEIRIWDTASGPRPLRRIPAEQRPGPYPSQASGGIEFIDEDTVVWSEERKNTSTVRTPLSQGFIDKPAENTWTLRRLSLRTGSGPEDAGNGLIAPTELLISFSGDGLAALTYDRENAMVRLRETQTARLLGQFSANATYADLAQVFFRSARGWRVSSDGSFEAGLKSGSAVALRSDVVTLRISGEDPWMEVRDPRRTRSADSSRWQITEQHLLSVSPSGRLVAVLAMKTPPGSAQQPQEWVRIQDSLTGSPVSQWLWHESPVLSASFTDDGWLLTLTAKGRLRRWPAELPDLARAAWLDGAAGPLSGMALQSGGETVAIAEPELRKLRADFARKLADAARRGESLAVWFRPGHGD